MYAHSSSTANIEHSTFESNTASRVSLLGGFLVVVKTLSVLLSRFCHLSWWSARSVDEHRLTLRCMSVLLWMSSFGCPPLGGRCCSRLVFSTGRWRRVCRKFFDCQYCQLHVCEEQSHQQRFCTSSCFLVVFLLPRLCLDVGCDVLSGPISVTHPVMRCHRRTML